MYWRFYFKGLVAVQYDSLLHYFFAFLCMHSFHHIYTIHTLLFAGFVELSTLFLMHGGVFKDCSIYFYHSNNRWGSGLRQRGIPARTIFSTKQISQVDPKAGAKATGSREKLTDFEGTFRTKLNTTFKGTVTRIIYKRKIVRGLSFCDALCLYNKFPYITIFFQVNFFYSV